MIEFLHFSTALRKNICMGQMSFFSRAETAAMRDRTKARNYDPGRDEFRRQQRIRRDCGLQRRHAEKLRRLHESGAVSRRPSAIAKVQARPERCTSRPMLPGRRPGYAGDAPTSCVAVVSGAAAVRWITIARSGTVGDGSACSHGLLGDGDQDLAVTFRLISILVAIDGSCELSGMGRRPPEGRDLLSILSTVSPERRMHSRRRQYVDHVRGVASNTSNAQTPVWIRTLWARAACHGRRSDPWPSPAVQDW
jgi:hypothetical protein